MTTNRKKQQTLPPGGPARESLREKGQFWTPAWVAEAMAAYVLGAGCDTVFDPAVGAGALLRGAKTVARETGREISVLGTELDREALRQAVGEGLSAKDLEQVEVRDFVLNPPERPFRAIVANPPYIRHHRLPSAVKANLAALARQTVGRELDGRAGLHVYFLLRALQLLATDGRLGFIMPADTCEGVFSRPLWHWITASHRLEAVVTFAPDASPFPGVDTNPLIFMIRNCDPRPLFFWAKCTEARTNELKEWVLSGFTRVPRSGTEVRERLLSEGLRVGLSRPPLPEGRSGPPLARFARVLRGIATGANSFFLLTRKQAVVLKIPCEFLVPAISRTRDAAGDRLAPENLRKLDARGRPTLLFSPDGRPLEEFPAPVQEYLRHGEAIGVHKRPLIATRSPWYRMEVREPPPVLFAYLGRRNARFIRNSAGVVPLTGLLCVYPKSPDPRFLEALWLALSDPEAIRNLSFVGKSYGAGAIKVEPRALERLPIPTSVMSRVRLPVRRAAEQVMLLDTHQIFGRGKLNMGKLEILQALAEAVDKLDVAAGERLAREALNAGIPPYEIISEGLSRGMQVIGEKFKCAEVYLPEVLVACDVYYAGLNVVRPHIEPGDRERFAGTMVIGTIYGDVHTVGKDVAIPVFEAAGFHVFDLGAAVPDEKFVEAIREHKPQLVGLGTYMTSTFMHTKDTVGKIKEAGLRDRVKIICGGPSVSPEAARRLGADDASDNAWQAVEKMRRLVAQLRQPV